MASLPRPTLAAIIGAAVLSTLSIGAAVGPARAAVPAPDSAIALSKTVGGSSNAAGGDYQPVRM